MTKRQTQPHLSQQHKNDGRLDRVVVLANDRYQEDHIYVNMVVIVLGGASRDYYYEYPKNESIHSMYAIYTFHRGNRRWSARLDL